MHSCLSFPSTPHILYILENRVFSFTPLTTTTKMVYLPKLATTALLATSAMAAPHGVSHVHKRSDTTKRGACYSDASVVQPIAHAVSWAYDWNMFPDGILPLGVEFVPMLWGSKMFGGWGTAIQTSLSSGSKYILGFNEPDNPGQASMSPSDAVDAYHQYITPFAGRASLVSPAVTNGQGPSQGLDWLKSFMDACADCSIEALAVHWYGDSADDFKDFVTQAIDLGNQYGIGQVWVTEFALNSAIGGGDASGSADFLNEVMPWLDSQANVARYAYYMVADGHMVNGGSLSPSGEAYAS